MKRRKLEEALSEISDAHIAEAARAKKKRKPWLGAIAAVLVLVVLFQFIDIPMVIASEVVSKASDPRITERPDLDDFPDRDAWRQELDKWDIELQQRASVSEAALSQMQNFFKNSCLEFLSDSSANQLYSPINAYIGLAMCAELTAGQTRQQILDTLGVADLATLRQQISALWETAYRDNGNEICTLANALWLDKSLSYSQEVMDVLAQDYYASVYRQNLSGSQVTKDIQAWLNNNTGGLLRDSVNSIQLPEEAVLALYSTIYFQSKWQNEFSAAKNTRATFHAPTGDITCTFMNQKLQQMNYYWGEDYGAVSLGLKNGSKMWFILPDEGKTIDDVLASDEYLRMIAAPYEGWENTKYMKVNLSVPKFDILAKQDLRSGFVNMGITDMFQYETADFSEAFDGQVFMTAANQAVRVEIDEQGVKAAAYIEFPGTGAAAPPEEIIDFVLDRPFLFVISDSGIPLFAGAVNQP